MQWINMNEFACNINKVHQRKFKMYNHKIIT